MPRRQLGTQNVKKAQEAVAWWCRSRLTYSRRGDVMKLIEAVIEKFKLQEVRSALEDMGVVDFMESTIICHGQKGQVMIFRGAKFVANFVEKVKLEIKSADDAAEKVIEAIGCVVKSGRDDDCRIAIRPYLEIT